MAALLRLILVLVYAILLSHSHTISKTLPGFPGQLPFKLETGYIGVGELENIQLFYYFVESERDPKNDPLMIRFPGGPGCSGLRGFFFGIGPLAFNYTKSKEDEQNLELNPYSWTKVANIIFIDPPASGFSYAKTPETYKNSDSLTAKYTYEFLRKWLNSHPMFGRNPVYVVGASYSGITVPLIVQDIFNGNEAGNEPPINIKGYVLGNPLADRIIDFNARIPYAHRVALLSDDIYESSTKNCHGDFITWNSNNSLCAKNLEEVNKCLEDVYINNILEPVCTTEVSDLLKSDGRPEEKNRIQNSLQLPHFPEQWCREQTYEYIPSWTNRKTVQKALNIVEGTVTCSVNGCNVDDHYWFGKNDTATYSYDVPSSLAYHKFFTQKSVRALIYSGDHDMTFPYVGTRKWIRSLNLSVDNTWKPWFVNNQVAGYMETYSGGDYSLKFATVKGAGHMAQEYKPEQCQALIDRWLNYSLL